VISTTVGAEGLSVHPPDDILIADSAAAFAECALEVLEDAARRRQIATAALEMVASRYSWEQVSRCFDEILQGAPRLLCAAGK
jgi:glycosyltransferase involved in cell wall biosynthesis